MDRLIDSSAGPWVLAVLLVGLSLLLGCPKKTHHGIDRQRAPAAWVVFDVVEKGSGNSIPTYVWVDGHQEDFETVMGGNESEARFEGFGKTGDGYVVGFSPSQKVRFHAWSPGHELITVDAKIRRGENVIALQLRKTEVEDDQVPESIRLDVLERLPTEKPKTGS